MFVKYPLSFLLLIHFLVFPRVGFSSSESTNSLKTMTAARSSILNCRMNEHAILDETCWMKQLKCKTRFHATFEFSSNIHRTFEPKCWIRCQMHLPRPLNSDKFLKYIKEKRKTNKVVGERMWHVITGDRFMAYSPL